MTSTQLAAYHRRAINAHACLRLRWTGQEPVLINMPAAQFKAIAGGSTVGLATAVFLGHHCVRSLVVEHRDTPSDHPRALGLSPRTLEFFREVGMRDEMDEVAVRSAQLWRAEARTVAEIDHDPVVRSPLPAGVELSPEDPRGHYPQDRLDAALIPAARKRGATIEFGVDVRSITRMRREFC